MEYTFDTKRDKKWSGDDLNGLPCNTMDNPLKALQVCFDDMKKTYINSRNIFTETYIEDYGEEEGIRMMNDRYPKPINIDELANQAKIIANKYEVNAITANGPTNSIKGFVVKIPNVRVRCRTYINLGDYYLWFRKWKLNEMKIQIYQAYPNWKSFNKKNILFKTYGGSGYPHPHIAGNNPCLGSFEGAIKNSAGHFNIVGVINNIKRYLNSYYSRSTYQRGTYYKPTILYTPNLETIHKYPGSYFSYDSFLNNTVKFEDIANMSPKKYEKHRDIWKEKWFNDKYLLSLQPHVGWYYNRLLGETNNWDGAWCGSKIVLKVLLVMKHFKIEDYWLAYVALHKHCSINFSGINIADKLPVDYQDAYDLMYYHLHNRSEREFRIGFSTKRIHPDIYETSLEKSWTDLTDIVCPIKDRMWDTIRNIKCNEFYKTLKSYKTKKAFLTPNKDAETHRIYMAKEMINNLYPKYMDWRSSYTRKILISLDKEKRRLTNGLNYTNPSSESGQLSFETFPEDRVVGSSVVSDDNSGQ